MQFQLAVYADIVVDRIADDVAMGAKVMLLDEVSLNFCKPAEPQSPPSLAPWPLSRCLPGPHTTPLTML